MKNLIIIIQLSIAVSISAQKIEIKGKIIDDENKPLPFSHISTGKNIGTISNSEGEFALIIPNPSSNDSIIISYIGYKKLKNSLNSLKRNCLNIFKLEQEIITLNEVVVRPFYAESLIDSILKYRFVNYRTSAFQTTSFYREIGMLDSSYLGFDEGVFKILNPGYDKSTDKILLKLEKGRKLKKIGDKEVNNPFNETIKGIPFALLENDIAHSPWFFDKKFRKKHDFKIVGNTKVDNDEAYIVEFDQKENLKEAMYKGKIVISKNTYAIISFDLRLSPTGLRYAKPDIPAIERPFLRLLGFTAKKLSEGLTLRYYKINGIWFLYYIKISTSHYVKIRSKKIEGNLLLQAEMLNSKFEDANYSEFKKEDLVTKKFSLQENNIKYDNDFWDEYNFIKPDSELIKIGTKLIKE
jgi:CarboxypepD_reg-like domain